MGEGLLDRRFGDLAEGDAAGLLWREVGRLGDVPGDRLTLAVEVGGEVDEVRGACRADDVADLLAPVRHHLVLGLEVVLDVDAQLVATQFLGKVAHVTIGGEHPMARAKISLDRFRLGRRLDDHQVASHRAAV